MIVVIGTWDTKGEELEFLAQRIERRGHDVLRVDAGTGGELRHAVDIERKSYLPDAELPQDGERGGAVTAVGLAAARLLPQLHREGRLEGVISAGGGGGTSIASTAFRALPYGVPKVLVSTLASGNTAPYLGTRDLLLVPSIVDVSGLNSTLRGVLARAAAAVCAMTEANRELLVENAPVRPQIAASMFGNTTALVDAARARLEAQGYDVLVFHATGIGGRTMENLIAERHFCGVLDLTTTEWADEVSGGILGAGPDRLGAAAAAGISAVVAPGCLDMINFGERATVPGHLADRLFYQHNPQVTLMRTSAEEYRAIAARMAAKLNASTGPVAVALPRNGFSIVGAEGGPFHDPEADAVFCQELSAALREGIQVIHYAGAINDPAFAELCTETLLSLMKKSG